MLALGVIVLNTAGNEGIRVVLLSLLVVAIVLLLMGSTIALLTLRSHLRGQYNSGVANSPLLQPKVVPKSLPGSLAAESQ